ncbi:hypothetical protein DEO72_LG1g3315 [Vigna unguiculata]|uniref:Uncharacterized protein n=1 Tax=Vigna unguiculata TaxID=3917 RepID=A0A4D6KPQ7_VIGUN|nr:hypothetical protein DEO72_LG1g3315 [Vigna unguiculata]
MACSCCHGGVTARVWSAVFVASGDGAASGAVLLRCYAASWWLPWDSCWRCTHVEIEMVLRTCAGATSTGLVRWVAAFAQWCKRLKMVELRCRRAECKWCGAEMENGDGGGLVFRNMDVGARCCGAALRWLTEELR